MSLESALTGQLEPGRPSVVTIGTFDGVHQGHRRLLSVARAEADRRGRPGTVAAVAITFKQQPRVVLRPELKTVYLCSLEERVRLLGEVGLDAVIAIDFDDSVRTLSALEFARLLKERLNMVALVLGPNTSIGHDLLRERPELEAMASKAGVDLRIVEPAIHDGKLVSSSAIRSALGEGRVREASEMLGRRFSITGTVEHGDGRGRKLGYPTANLKVPADLATPADGIYAAHARADSAARPAAVSIGTRPTFGGGGRRIEAHLLDFEGSLYGRALRLEFIDRLRNELKFDSVELLVSQMNEDVGQTRLLAVSKEEVNP